MHRLQRQPAPRRRRGRAAPRPHDRRVLPAPLGKLAAEFAAWKPNATRAEDRRRVAPRDRQPAAIPRQRGAGVFDPRPARPDALRRRDAADSPGRPGGQRAVRRALRARRADHRTASARQPPPAGRPAEAPRPGQHAVGRRARPRGGRRGGSTVGLRPRGGPIRRADRRPRNPCPVARPPRIGHRSVPVGQEGDPRAQEPADAQVPLSLRGQGRGSRQSSIPRPIRQVPSRRPSPGARQRRVRRPAAAGWKSAARGRTT